MRDKILNIPFQSVQAKKSEDMLEERKLRWVGHTVYRDNNRIPCQSVQWKP